MLQLEMSAPRAETREAEQARHVSPNIMMAPRPRRLLAHLALLAVAHGVDDDGVVVG